LLVGARERCDSAGGVRLLMEFGRCVCVKVKLRIVAVPGLRAKVLALIKGGDD